MTLEDKVRFGMVALSGASIVFATLVLHISPLETIGRWGIQTEKGRRKPLPLLRSSYLHQQLLELPQDFGLVEHPFLRLVVVEPGL